MKLDKKKLLAGILALVIAAFCWWALRDTPESCGLPSVQEYRNDYSGVKSKQKSGEKPFKGIA